MSQDAGARPRRTTAGIQVGVTGAAGVLAAVVTGLTAGWALGPALGWDVASLAYLVWVWSRVWPMSAEATASHAVREDPTRPVADLVVLAASIMSLVSVGFVLVKAHSASGAAQGVDAGLGVLTVALSWLTVHTIFTLRYAYLYFSGSEGGVEFNQKVRPRFSDFAYLAFTLGMTFQVSDTNLTNPTIRATALRHALLSYLFGAVIVATTINLIAGLG